MPDSHEAEVFSCPSCGSAIAMEGERGACVYCGAAIERPSGVARMLGASSPGGSLTKPIPRAVRAGAPQRGASARLVVALVLIAALAGFGVGRALPSRTVAAPTAGPGAAPTIAPSSPQAEVAPISAGSVSDLAAVLPRDGPGGDLIVYAYHSGSNGSSFYTVARIDGQTRAARWQSPALSKDATRGTLVASRDTLYLTDQDKLLALRLSDGAPAWQVTLDVEPPNGCEECLRVGGDRVVVLEKNGGLQAFDAQSGQRAWSTRLADQPRTLPLVGERLVTIQPSQDKDGQLLSFLSMAGGKATLQLDPHCPRAQGSTDDERPEPYSPFLFSADGSAMYTIYGFFKQCAQAWDLATGKVRWQVPIDDRLAPGSWSQGSALLTEQALFAGNGQLLWSIDTADGKVRILDDDKEYNLTPLAERSGMLIALASPNWDSQRQILWGLDAKTGERHWQYKLQGHTWLGQSSSGDWEAQLTPKGLVVLQVLRDEARLVVETLDPRTGTSAGRQESELTDMHMPGLRRSLWGEDTAWLEIDSDIFAVDLASGKIMYHLE
ncbi:MAG: PQQ-binding-like beta-propeller repeat protein [Kouleothrix sp.]|nr:PQQ-binding-like beta-propeller repeat protein [Kouleothrix sp.]